MRNGSFYNIALTSLNMASRNKLGITSMATQCFVCSIISEHRSHSAFKKGNTFLVMMCVNGCINKTQPSRILFRLFTYWEKNNITLSELNCHDYSYALCYNLERITVLVIQSLTLIKQTYILSHIFRVQCLKPTKKTQITQVRNIWWDFILKRKIRTMVSQSMLFDKYYCSYIQHHNQ